MKDALVCPSCGAPCSPDARACKHCDVPLPSVRCARCFALHFQGSRYCTRCAAELFPEPPLVATNAPCPRCRKPLSTLTYGSNDSASTDTIEECVACGGLFIGHHTLSKLIARRDHEEPVPLSKEATRSEKDLEVHYLSCPFCQKLMNRVNFKRQTGVIVDVCKAHGIWFDSGELTRALESLASG